MTPIRTSPLLRPIRPTARTVDELLESERRRAVQAIADGAAGAGHAVVAATGVRARIDRAPLLAIGAAALLGLVAGRGLLAITTRARRRTVQRPPRSSIAAALVLASLRLLGR